MSAWALKNFSVPFPATCHYLSSTFIPISTSLPAMLQAIRPDGTAQQEHTKPEDDQKQCLLFKLPPELRNCIYSYATSQSEINNKPWESELPLGKGSQLTYNYDPSSDYNDHQSFPVVNMNQLSEAKPSNALLGTCQRIHEEAKAMFAASQRTFWKSHALLIDLNNDCTNGVSSAQDIVARLHPKQIDSMPKFSVALTIRGCLHTFHFIADDIETTDDEINQGYATNCGFCHGGCSHAGELSHRNSDRYVEISKVNSCTRRLTSLSIRHSA